MGESPSTTTARPPGWAVVVGAHGAFGSAITARLCAAGLRVLAVARSRDSLQGLVNSLGSAGSPCVADISEDASIATIAASLDGPVKMIVHAPGVPVAGGVAEVTTDAITAAVNIKVNGLLRVVRAADHRLGAGSRIVAIGGHYGFEPTAYAATAGVANAALANIVRQLSWAYGPRGITAHLLAPGPADTERLRRIAQRRAATEGLTEERFFADLSQDSAIGRLTTPEQVAWAVALLLAPEADALAGSSLMLDSGRRRGLP